MLTTVTSHSFLTKLQMYYISLTKGYIRHNKVKCMQSHLTTSISLGLRMRT